MEVVVPSLPQGEEGCLMYRAADNLAVHGDTQAGR